MEKYKILYVEDDATEYEMVKALLESSNVLDSITNVHNKKDFLREIRTHQFDVILTDFSLQFFHGFEVLQILEKEDKDIPVIFITGTLPDEISAEVIKRGAADYLQIQNIYRVIPSIRSAVERKKMLQEKNLALTRLRESEENYRILAESSPYGIVVHSNFRLKYYNNQALKIFQADENKDYHNVNILEFVNPHYRDIVVERSNLLYNGISLPEFFEEKFTSVSGELLQVEVASTSIMFYGEMCAQVIFRDISERKRMEYELVKAKEKAEESDKLKTAFLENMSHEIRTPLNGIIGFSTLLKYKKLEQQERVKYLEIIEQSGKHLLNIINDLIEISRIESGHIDIKYEQTNLNNILDDLLLFFTNSAKIRGAPVQIVLSKAVDDDKSYVNTDHSRLKQVLINLLNNALKFTRDGSIDFGYEIDAEGWVTFFVKDTGIGIPDKSKEFIFERFRQADDTSTREYGGAGLGLTISKGLVEIMGGKIWFESIHGKGTSFFFTLPMIPASAHFPGDESINESFFEANWNDKHILIVEDEHSNVLLLKHILKSTGITIDVAFNGFEALEKLGNSDQPYDIVLMDIKMPVMDGLQAIREIRERKINVPVIAQTAYAMTDDKQKCINAGFDEYITKPIKAYELLYKINAMIKKKNTKTIKS